MLIRLLCIGKLNSKLYGSLFDHFKKQMSYLTVIEFEESKKSLASERINEECNSILKFIKPEDFNIGLFIEGSKLSSTELATLLKEHSAKHLNFIIGGSDGLNLEVKSQCHKLLSISNMTFPHQLCRILVLEQIYRSNCINIGKVYHK